MRINRKELTISGLQKSYRFLQIADTHVGRAGLTRNGITSAERLEELIRCADRAKLSGVLLTGDILDDPSEENLEFLETLLNSLSVPWMYVPGNHDWSYPENYHTAYAIKELRPLLRPFCCDPEQLQIKRIGELIFVGTDNSMDMYPRGTAKQLQKILRNNEENPVIFLQHIPFACGTLAEASMQRWGMDLTLGNNLPEQGGCRESFEDGREVIREMITGANTVKAVLCGHVHVDHKDMLSGKIPQYVAPEGCFGEAALLEIHG